MTAWFAVVELRALRDRSTDTPIYLSNLGGSRVVSGTLQNFRAVASFGRLSERFGGIEAALQSPSSLGIEVANGDGFYDDLLPGGSNAQFWIGSKVTVYRGGVDGDDVSTMTNAGEFFIVDGSLRYSPSFISFEAQDARLMHDAKIAVTRLLDTANFNPAKASASGGTTVPIILGDWTDTKLPAHRIDGADNGTEDTVWKVCDHEIGTVTVYVDGATVTPKATNYASGEFTIDQSDWTGSEPVEVTCEGHQSTITDPNAITMFKGLVSLFADTSIASVSYYTGSEVGNVDDAYTHYGGANPIAKYRRYITGETTLLQEIAVLAKESTMLPWIEGTDYRIIYDATLILRGSTAVTPTSVSERDIQADQNTPESTQNPEGEYANVGVIGYAVDANGTPTKVFDSRDDLSGIVQDSREKYGQDIFWTDTYVYLYEGSPQIEQTMFRRSGQQVYAQMTLTADEATATIWGIGLAQPITVDYWRLQDQELRVVGADRDMEALRIDITARNMSTLPVLYRWTDNNGQVDGITQTDNTWRSDTDTTGGIWA